MSVDKVDLSSQDPVEENTDPVQEPDASTLTADRDQLVADKADLQDRLLRAQAEFQNLRKRTEREKLESYEYAAMEAVRALLPVLDDFERAMKSPSADKEYSAGIELIYNRFYEALKKLGLTPIESEGKPFDPQIHHAVDMVETDAAPDHTVLEEFQRGYNFKGRLLRPAMVKVAVEPASK